jgi:hypothetical protein
VGKAVEHANHDFFVLQRMHQGKTIHENIIHTGKIYLFDDFVFFRLIAGFSFFDVHNHFDFKNWLLWWRRPLVAAATPLQIN